MSPRLSDAWIKYADLILQDKKGQYIESLRWETHISRYYGKLPLEEITTDTILKLRKSVERKGLAPQTVYHCLSLTRRVMRYALDAEMYQGQLPKFLMPKFDNRSVRFLSKGEADLLLMYLRDMSDLWHDIALFALHTGMRAGEIFRLKTYDVNLDSNMIHVIDTKSSRNRVVPLNEISKGVIERNIKPSVYNKNVFTNGGSEITYVNRTYRNAVKKCRYNYGVSDRRQRVVFHTLRHTFATWLVQRGVPIATVGQLLGHADVRMTMRYSQFAPDYAQRSVQLLCE
ncbi:MAG: site-specific integrase [Pseudodesulfovibrio sp.]|nr:site-specific integrase [Pseudodesulfovibrio sp.]